MRIIAKAEEDEDIPEFDDVFREDVSGRICKPFLRTNSSDGL